MSTTLHYDASQRGMRNEYGGGGGMTFRNDDESGSRLKSVAIAFGFVIGAAVIGTVVTLALGQTSMTPGWQDVGLFAFGIVGFGVAAMLGHPRVAFMLGAGPATIALTRQTVAMWAARTAQNAVDQARALANNAAASTPATGTPATTPAGLPVPGVRSQNLGVANTQAVPVF